MTEHAIPIDPLPLEAVAPRNRAPAGTTDCHFHIFGAKDRYRLSPHRMYEPSDASVERYLAMARTVGIERMVVVNGSPYGTDNECIMDAIDAFGHDRARGVAVVDPDVSDAELARLNRRGIRGIRFNAITARTPLSALSDLGRRIAPMGWHIQMWIRGERLVEVAPVLEGLPVPVVIDHMGQVPTSLGMDHPQFRTLIRLLESGKAWVKLVGYRVSEGPPYTDLLRPVAAMIEAAPDRCVWGTDWPHPYLEGRPMPNDGDLLDLLFTWADKDQVRRILVDNPARLYGF